MNPEINPPNFGSPSPDHVCSGLDLPSAGAGSAQPKETLEPNPTAGQLIAGSRDNPFFIIDVPRPPKNVADPEQHKPAAQPSSEKIGRRAITDLQPRMYSGHSTILPRRASFSSDEAIDEAINSWRARREGRKTTSEQVIDKWAEERQFRQRFRAQGLPESQIDNLWQSAQTAARRENAQMQAMRRQKLAQNPPFKWPEE